MLQLHEPHPGVRVVEVTGDTPMVAARALVVDAIVVAQAEGVRRLAIDITAASGLGAPHIGTRLDIVREWAEVARPGLAMAFVAPAALVDTQGVALVVARGLGLMIDVFTSREEAVDWLRAQRLPLAG